FRITESMANLKSVRKRARQAVVRRGHNLGLRTAVRSAIKNVKKAVAAGNKDAAAKALLASQRAIDRVVAKGVLHRNAGNRHKSRLAHAVKGLKEHSRGIPDPLHLSELRALRDAPVSHLQLV